MHSPYWAGWAKVKYLFYGLLDFNDYVLYVNQFTFFFVQMYNWRNETAEWYEYGLDLVGVYFCQRLYFFIHPISIPSKWIYEASRKDISEYLMTFYCGKRITISSNHHHKQPFLLFGMIETNEPNDVNTNKLSHLSYETGAGGCKWWIIWNMCDVMENVLDVVRFAWKISFRLVFIKGIVWYWVIFVSREKLSTIWAHHPYAWTSKRWWRRRIRRRNLWLHSKLKIAVALTFYFPFAFKSLRSFGIKKVFLIYRVTRKLQLNIADSFVLLLENSSNQNKQLCCSICNPFQFFLSHFFRRIVLTRCDTYYLLKNSLRILVTWHAIHNTSAHSNRFHRLSTVNQKRSLVPLVDGTNWTGNSRNNKKKRSR